ncbi:HAD family hydrolase [Aliamphritea ceti]|uniref:HAD family hydrolase n=1 Tax=Aliamphritea ceti TaxID=1524258 RepID=UPI0021C29CBA|nr:HAD family hydrolase [Aliamphritea ceti]
MFDLNKFRHWVFDLDGTLTRPVHDFAHMRRELGIPEGEAILETIEQTPEPQKQVLLQRLDELEGYYARQAEPAEGVQDLIVRLHAAGCKLGILTRNKKDFAISSLQAIGVGEYFHAEEVLGRDEARPKPDPEGLQKLCQRWKVVGDELIMVGDFRFDLEAGKAIDAQTVHVSAVGTIEWPELTDVRIHSLAELL